MTDRCYPHIAVHMAHLYGWDAFQVAWVVRRLLLPHIEDEAVTAVIDELMNAESYDDFWRAINTVIEITDWDEIESQMEEGEA